MEFVLAGKLPGNRLQSWQAIVNARVLTCPNVPTTQICLPSMTLVPITYKSTLEKDAGATPVTAVQWVWSGAQGSVLLPDSRVMLGLCSQERLSRRSIPDHPLFLGIWETHSRQCKPLLLHTARSP